MTVTKDDIRAEHEAAILSLTNAQRAAFKRINRSFQEARFNNYSAKDMLDQVFEEEATRRNTEAASDKDEAEHAS